MIVHENRLLIIPYFFCKLGKMLQNLWSAAVVIGALQENPIIFHHFTFNEQFNCHAHLSSARTKIYNLGPNPDPVPCSVQSTIVSP